MSELAKTAGISFSGLFVVMVLVHLMGEELKKEARADFNKFAKEATSVCSKLLDGGALSNKEFVDTLAAGRALKCQKGVDQHGKAAILVTVPQSSSITGLHWNKAPLVVGTIPAP